MLFDSVLMAQWPSINNHTPGQSYGPTPYRFLFPIETEICFEQPDKRGFRRRKKKLEIGLEGVCLHTPLLFFWGPSKKNAIKRLTKQG
jgi:hypothetical protein